MKEKSINKRWVVNNKTCANVIFNIVWTTKFARSVLCGEVVKVLKNSIIEVCGENDWSIKFLQIEPNNVQILLKCRVIDSPAYIVAQLKGRSSHNIKDAYPKLWGKLPNLWTRSFFVESIGVTSAEKVSSFIESQKWSKNKN